MLKLVQSQSMYTSFQHQNGLPRKMAFHLPLCLENKLSPAFRWKTQSGIVEDEARRGKERIPKLFSCASSFPVCTEYLQ